MSPIKYPETKSIPAKKMFSFFNSFAIVFANFFSFKAIAKTSAKANVMERQK